MCDIRLLQMGPWQSPSQPHRAPETMGGRTEDPIQTSCAVTARGRSPQDKVAGEAGTASLGLIIPLVSVWGPLYDQVAQV